MTSTATNLDYPAGDITCKGVYFTPDGASGPLPVVIVCHAWDGLNDEVRDKAAKLADSGYIAFAMDVYGDGKTMTDMSELESTLTPYMADRGMLLQRTQAALAAAKTIPGADTTRIGAMGYCFGGLAVLDLARAGGEDIQAFVSFHGGLGGNTLDNPATLSSKVLVLHGEDDPMVPPEEVAAFKAEMTAKKADWQLVAYSQTVHAFTRPGANDPAFGAVYNPTTDKRSWQAMLSFFAETL
ncbi:MAG: dienelactone hydrolase [Halioglobus sp.]|jgi:dienelactone hydrolase